MIQEENLTCYQIDSGWWVGELLIGVAHPEEPFELRTYIGLNSLEDWKSYLADKKVTNDIECNYDLDDLLTIIHRKGYKLL